MIGVLKIVPDPLIHLFISIYSNLGEKLLLNQAMIFKIIQGGFPGGSVVKNQPANARYSGSSPDSGWSQKPRSN